jgi:uncharacterized membrane protein YgcG
VLRQFVRGRRAAVVLAVALLTLLAAPAPARADAPMRLDDQLTDRVGALDDRRDEAQAALDRLRAETGLQLFVVFVDSFDAIAAEKWTSETARLSDLGDRDALLAVATGDRAYWYSFDTDFPLSAAQLEDVAAVSIEPALAQNDWAGGVVGAADGYRAALAGNAPPPPKIVPGDPDPGDGLLGGSGGRSAVPVAVICVGLVVVAGAVGIWLFVRGRDRGKAVAPTVDPNDPFPGVDTRQLSDRANSLLIEVDDALISSERELRLATSEFGAEATSSFAAALDEARREVTEAFRLRLLLDEPTDASTEGRSPPVAPTAGPSEAAPTDETGRRRVLAEIIHRCERADARLDAESDAFDALRELEARLESAIGELDRQSTDLRARLPVVRREIGDLRQRYTGPALNSVAGNPDTAEERVSFGTAALARASDRIRAGQRPAATLAVRAAEQAFDQAVVLLDAVTRTGSDLDTARTALDTLLVEVESDLDAARRAQGNGSERGGAAASGPRSTGSERGGAPASGPRSEATREDVGLSAAGASDQASLAAAVTLAAQAIEAVRTALAAPTVDPLSAVRQLEDADGALDRALAAVRDAAERAERARAVLDQAILAARAEIAAATDFVITRRGAVGGQARTLLAEAQRRLDRAVALAADDPVAALAEAQQADRLAEQASRAAQADVDGWRSGGFAGRPGGGDAFGGGLAGAILGGILMGGAGRHHHHGSTWSSGSGGFGGGFGGSGGFGGGFGGSGARHGGGGRF